MKKIDPIRRRKDGTMKIKNVWEMDHYEILNLDRNATPQEIDRAYRLGKATYHPDSMAPYSLLSEEERQAVLERIEKAYRTLSHPKKRRLYDLQTLDAGKKSRESASFRKSTERLLIEDPAEEISLWRKLKYFLFRPIKR